MLARFFARYPTQIKYIVGNEVAERFTFYGMRSILLVYATQYLLMGKAEATSDIHIFFALVYFFPLLGGLISDVFWGKYRTIMTLSLVYIAGCLVVALVPTVIGMKIGLLLIAIGSGGIKPCVSANVGDQFKEDQKDKMREVFNIFYFTINFGSFFATLLIPLLLAKFNPTVACMAPAMSSALLRSTTAFATATARQANNNTAASRRCGAPDGGCACV